jgi:CheY-like chemotaxis protein
MVVDDEPQILEIIKSMLKPFGCDAVTCADSREAAERAENEKFDGIFLDFQMPHMDGIELTKRIRQSSANREVSIVMLTALDDVDSMRSGFKAGVSCFLGKPIDAERLTGLIKAMRGPMLRDKRRHARLPFRTSVKCKIGPSFENSFIGSSLTLGEGGMSLTPSGGLEEGGELQLEFRMAGLAKLLTPRGKVVRKDPPDQVAIAFTSLAEMGREAICRYIEGAMKL